jgi:hypothetical protein
MQASPVTWLTEYSNQEKLITELIKLAKIDDNVAAVIEKMGATDRDLQDIYHMLQSNGAGQYASGHYVAASSLVYWQPLYFLLYHFDKGQFKIKDYDNRNSQLFIANRLIEYFQNGETGDVRFDGD